MSDPIRIGGFFATFDTEAVIRQLTAIRMRQVDLLDQKAAQVQRRKDAIGSVQSAMNALLAKVKALTAAQSVSGMTATVSGSGVTASALPGAQPGSFTVNVSQLATATRLQGTPISAGIDATKPMNRSNFGTVPTNGTFTIATAMGGSQTFTVGPAAAQASVALQSANIDMAVTSGTFTVGTTGGGTATITVDVTTQSLNDVVTAINSAGVGLTASIVADANGRLNRLQLVSTNGDVVLGGTGDSSNFLSAMRLLGSTPGTTRTGDAFTQHMTLNDVIADINASSIGVTASISNDSWGRPNLVTVTSTQGAISFGSGSDTSNFLAATGLLTSAAGTTRTSSGPIARLGVSAKLADAGLQGGAPAAGDHELFINGVSIAYNAATDSLLDIVARINASGAGVTARYDSLTDTIRLQNKATGNLMLTVEDDTYGGNLAAKLGLTTGTVTAGQNAVYSIDGGPAQESASNGVSYGGTSLTLTETTSSPVTVTVSHDTSAGANAIKAFVTEFNNVMKAIDAATKADGSRTNNQSGPLSGDMSLRQLKSDLRSLITSPGTGLTGGYTTLSQIGLTFGAVGSAIGTTNTLQFDEAKFAEAVRTNQAGVQELLSRLSLSATLEPGGTGSITGISGTYAGLEPGRWEITDDGAGNLTATFTPANGGPPTTATATVVANGTNSNLIPGITLQIGPTLQAGTHTITVGATAESVLQRLKRFAETQAGVGGTLDKRKATFDRVSNDISERIATLEKRIEAEMEQLRRKFAAMEQAQARAQGILSSLQQMARQLGGSNGQN
ncbi:flagellar filament capping protein FliD [Tepidiforma sp.]|uniref:flagellar filament capping protein FliD n=1 Tax=Tepidiforma sp. TaxID=2682230 RepID=UPI002ADD48C2|nr:flagellar filament capping protein FliD [Tepidiforma sp.]